METKTCTDCKKKYLINNFYRRFDRKNKYSSYCKRCFNIRNVKKLQNKKQMIIKYKGNKCFDCGVVDEQCVYDLHHLDASKKDFKISKFQNLSFKNIKPELDKCILICANCHRKRHFNSII